jgi:formylglycine-generating enzyme required for sulfatase activity
MDNVVGQGRGTFVAEAARAVGAGAALRRCLLGALFACVAGLESSAQQPAAQEPSPARPSPALEEKLQQVSLDHPKARFSWRQVRSAVAASPQYKGRKVDLRDERVRGLVPIGENPVTKLWEFYELRSAWDGEQDPRELVIPEQGADGAIEVTGETGIVFVLLPGGSFLMGAQDSDPDKPRFDPNMKEREALVTVELAPFLLARHELTQGQWARLALGTAAPRQPSFFRVGQSVGGKALTLANPVEQVDWSACRALLTRHQMVLPTEAQWEYGARAGTSTPWWPGDKLEDMAGRENLRDAAAFRLAPQWGKPVGFEDGHVATSPVGSFLPNAFGLYDVHGNVREWCEDAYEQGATEVRPKDGLRLTKEESRFRCYRGGCFSCDLLLTRASYRSFNVPATSQNLIGVRPARRLQE